MPTRCWYATALYFPYNRIVAVDNRDYSTGFAVLEPAS